MSNWILTIQCAIENCLYRRSYVDYAIRDYVIENLDKLEPFEVDQIRAIIQIGLKGVPAHKVDFWKKFLEKLSEKIN